MSAFVVLEKSQLIGLWNVSKMTYFVSSGALNLN